MITEGNVTYAKNVQEAVEKHEEAEAKRFEATVRKFNGDKLAAEKYLKVKAQVRAAMLLNEADTHTKRVWGS